MSKKLKLPEFDTFEDAYNEETNRVSSRDYFNGFKAIIEDEYDFIYGFISPTCYYDNAIVKSDDITIKKRTKQNLKRVYEKVVKQVYERYKKWVDSLYVQPQKGDDDGPKERRIDLDKVC